MRLLRRFAITPATQTPVKTMITTTTIATTNDTASFDSVVVTGDFGSVLVVILTDPLVVSDVVDGVVSVSPNVVVDTGRTDGCVDGCVVL